MVAAAAVGGLTNICSRFDNGVLSGPVGVVPTHVHAHRYTGEGTCTEMHTLST